MWQSEGMSRAHDLPDLAELIGPLLQRVPVDRQPLLLAVAERMAADRYRRWAAAAAPEHEAALLACAGREEEIARRVESLYSGASSVEREIVDQNPDLAEIDRTLFAPHPVEQQWVLQARGERLGAATWRAFAKRESRVEARDVFLGCALLEEQNAEFLESIGGPRRTSGG